MQRQFGMFQQILKILRLMKNDFEGIHKFKLIMPGLFILNILLFFFGPFYCPKFAQVLYFVWTLLITMKGLHLALMGFYCIYQNNRVIRRFENKVNLKKTQESPDIFHAIIIPNYNEPIEVLRETLKTLSKHSRSTQSYLIYLAMQKHEQNGEEKAEKLINEFKNSFKNIDFTIHEIQSHEYKSKASNVNWCARQLEEKFKGLGIASEKCFLTIIDADAELIELYMDELEDHIKANWKQRFTFVYGPFNIFAKNQENVPAMTRVFDHLVSAFQAPNIANFTGFGFAISNYTVSYNLAKRIDFWDTNEQSITEDLHFMQKASWKTHGEMKSVSIFVPVNLMNIQTGNGYWADVQAKFWQSERHCRCCNQIAYAIKMFFNEKFNWVTFKNMLIVFDTMALQVYYPVIMFALMYQKSVLSKHQLADLPISYETIDFFTMLILLGTVTFLINFEIITRRSKEKLFGRKNREWWKFLETPFIFVIVQYLMLFPTNVYAIFGSLKSNRQWFMAGRGNQKSQKI